MIVSSPHAVCLPCYERQRRSFHWHSLELELASEASRAHSQSTTMHTAPSVGSSHPQPHMPKISMPKTSIMGLSQPPGPKMLAVNLTSLSLLPYLQDSEIKDVLRNKGCGKTGWIMSFYILQLYVLAGILALLGLIGWRGIRQIGFTQANSHKLKSLFLIHINLHLPPFAGSCHSLALLSNLLVTPII